VLETVLMANILMFTDVCAYVLLASGVTGKRSTTYDTLAVLGSSTH